jgi:hypothetical protein
MNDTVRDSQFGDRRADDAWPAMVRRYDGIILLVIAGVLIIGGIVTRQDQRDNAQTFREMGQAISSLADEARGTKEALSGVERSVNVLRSENARWLTIEREVGVLNNSVSTNREELRELSIRVQRIEDQRQTERDVQRRP